MNSGHETVLLNEAIDALHIKNHGLYVDATLGGGGHTIEILKRGGCVIGVETDKSILEIAKKNIERACPAPQRSFAGPNLLTLVNDNFRNLDYIVEKYANSPVNGIIYDLGVSNFHLLNKEKGFSFRNPNAKLDMRLDQNFGSLTAADLLNSLNKTQLLELFSNIMEYRQARKCTNLVLRFRASKRFETVGDLLEALKGFGKSYGSNHPATTAFLALRIVVNSELDNTKVSLDKAVNLLAPGGVIAVITFHSGEDKLVKNIFRGFERNHVGSVITKKPIVPTSEEVEKNKSSRSAKLRVFNKNEN
jgi:16S rRNA (cytosine1402-N4)-methyltransferase